MSSNTHSDIRDQILMVSKAGAFDILQDQVKGLSNENAILRNRVKYLEELISEYTAKMMDSINKTDAIISDYSTKLSSIFKPTT